ncbi:hypothetical protein [Photorhabdus heterorhabditis]|nr:hypothetical protein [Photorhabdus heterorhabditis]
MLFFLVISVISQYPYSQVAALLAAFTYPSHIVIYAPGDAFTCRHAAI